MRTCPNSTPAGWQPICSASALLPNCTDSVCAAKSGGRLISWRRSVARQRNSFWPPVRETTRLHTTSPPSGPQCFTRGVKWHLVVTRSSSAAFPATKQQLQQPLHPTSAPHQQLRARTGAAHCRSPATRLRRSRLVSARLPAAARLLELAAHGAHVGARVAVRHTGRGAKVLDRLARVLGAAQQHAVLAGGPLQRQLVKGQALAASLPSGEGGAAGVRGVTTLEGLHLAVDCRVTSRHWAAHLWEDEGRRCDVRRLPLHCHPTHCLLQPWPGPNAGEVCVM